MNFISIDFETADGTCFSPCSLGMVKVVDGKEQDSFYSLIKTDAPFKKHAINIHHIKPEDVKHAPRLEELYPPIQNFIGDNILIAHGMKTEAKIMKEAFYAGVFPEINNTKLCTQKISQKIYGRKTRNTLRELVKDFIPDYQYDNPHNALNDARATSYLAMAMMQKKNLSLTDVIIAMKFGL